MKKIEQRLRDAIGLDASSIGSSAIHRTVRLRLKSLGLQTLEDYVDLIDHSPAERRELIESVVVSETWFFRDRESFRALNRIVKEEWLPDHPTGILRILSAPCSSGEEPYSLVMALLEAGLPPERFRIDGADVSERALRRAREAIFTRNSFRGKDLSFRDRFFYTVKAGFALDSSIRRCVHFFQGNILSADFPLRSVYDVIFCRNLLIYFDRATQTKAIERLNRMMVSRGVLFVGPAEQPLIAEHGFIPLGIPMAFAARKSGPAIARFAEHLLKPAKTNVQFDFPPRLNNPAGPPPIAEVSFVNKNPPGVTSEAVNDLETARMLADAGNLKEAASMCEALLRVDATSAHGWYLLGLIREASGDPHAIQCYRKALYLDPEHYETLLHMALLTEKDGNAAKARTYRNRAERLKNKTFREL